MKKVRRSQALSKRQLADLLALGHPSVRSAALAHNIEPSTLLFRLKKGLSVADAISAKPYAKPPNPRGRRPAKLSSDQQAELAALGFNSVAHAAREAGLKTATLWARLRKGGSIAEAISVGPRQLPAKPKKVDPKSPYAEVLQRLGAPSVRQAAKSAGLSDATVHRRLARAPDLEVALAMPVRKLRRGWRAAVEAEAKRRGFDNFAALCADLGRDPERVRNRMRAGHSLDEALTARTFKSRSAGISRTARAAQRAEEQATGYRVCVGCGETLPLASAWYAPHKKSAGGFRNECRDCQATRQRARSLKARYGLSLEQVNELLLAQGHACLICRRAISSPGSPYHVDHDHAVEGPGGVRGLLCPRCNWTVGGLETPKRGAPRTLVAKAIAYLASPPGPPQQVLGIPRRSPPRRSEFAMREHTLWRQHGLTPEDLIAMLTAQQGQCAICATGDPTEVDHHHSKRREAMPHGRPRDTRSRRRRHSSIDRALRASVRGVLCHACNLMIGHCGADFDRAEGLKRLHDAAAYLEQKAPKTRGTT